MALLTYSCYDRLTHFIFFQSCNFPNRKRGCWAWDKWVTRFELRASGYIFHKNEYSINDTYEIASWRKIQLLYPLVTECKGSRCRCLSLRETKTCSFCSASPRLVKQGISTSLLGNALEIFFARNIENFLAQAAVYKDKRGSCAAGRPRRVGFTQERKEVCCEGGKKTPRTACTCFRSGNII